MSNAKHSRYWYCRLDGCNEPVPDSLREVGYCTLEHSKIGRTVDQGLRYNADKIRWSLVPTEVLSEIAKHYTQGAKKYRDNNWHKGLSFNDTYDCAMRHIHLWKIGEEVDAETGSKHLISAIWNLMALVYFSIHYAVYDKFDDRIPGPKLQKDKQLGPQELLSPIWVIPEGYRTLGPNEIIAENDLHWDHAMQRWDIVPKVREYCGPAGDKVVIRMITVEPEYAILPVNGVKLSEVIDSLGLQPTDSLLQSIYKMIHEYGEPKQ